MATAVIDGDPVPRRWRLRLPEQLPNLTGKWLIAYSVLWALALLVATVAPLSTAVLNYHWLAHPVWRPHGLVTGTTDTGVTVKGVFGDEARGAGVRPGDRIVAVDGWRIVGRSGEDHLFNLLDGPEGSIDTLRLRSPSGAERDVVLASRGSTAAQQFRGTGVSRPAFDVAVHFFDVAILLILVPPAVLLFIRRRREIVPALLSMAFLIITGFATSAQPALASAGMSDELVQIIGGLFGWITLSLALIIFPDGRFVPKWTVAALLMIPMALLDFLVWHLSWLNNLLQVLFFLLAGIALVLRYRMVPAGPARQQLRWAFFGFFIGISLLIAVLPFAIAADPLVAGDPRWAVWLTVFVVPFAFVGLLSMALGLMVSVLKYRLYDADTVIGRSAAYGVLTIGFVALFAGTENLAQLIGERYFEHSIGIVAGAIGAAVAAAVVVPLHNRVHRWAERRFQKALIRLREGLPETVGDLRESASVDDLVGAVMTRVEAGVRSTREAVLLRKNGRWSVAGAHRVPLRQVREWRRGWTVPAGQVTLDRDRNDLVFPLRVRLCVETGDEPQTIGWLLLGPRPDGSFFGRDEREALAHVAGPVARAIHIAQVREQREASAEARLSGLEAMIARFAETLGRGAVGPAAA